MLSNPSFAHVLVGEPASTSPEHALAQHSRPAGIANRCRNVVVAVARAGVRSTAAPNHAPGESIDASQSERTLIPFSLCDVPLAASELYNADEGG
jgi:hypothetical protein